MASAAKRQAAADVVAQVDASAARTTRPISVHLTPFASLAQKLPLNDRRRWATFYGRTPSQVVRATLTKVRLAPSAARARPEGPEDVALLGPVAPELAGLLSGAPELVPFAIFWDGLTAPELQAELDALTRAGWRPTSLEGRPS